MPISCIVLAAGRGTRLRSPLSKMLIPLDGRPLVTHTVGSALALRDSRVIAVVGHQQAAVRAALASAFPTDRLCFAVQREQRGTGDAVRAGLGSVRGREGSVLILSGDVPLLSARTLGRLRQLQQKRRSALALLTMSLERPGKYGRVIRRDGQVSAVVEYLDATTEQRRIREVNAGIYCVSLGFLRREIKRLGVDNAQGEVYLTDLVASAARGDGAIALACDPQEVQGINTWSELARVEHVVQQRTAEALMAKGVRIVAPDRVVIQSTVRVAAQTVIGPNAELTGHTRIGRDCRIDAGAILQNCRIGDGAHIKPYTVLDGVAVAAGAVIGPFAHRSASDAKEQPDKPDSPTTAPPSPRGGHPRRRPYGADERK